MKSMTGYGRGEASGDNHEVVVELSSVNRKALDVSVSLPREWATLERVVVDRVRAGIARGAIRVVVQISAVSAAASLDVDDAAVHATLDKLAELARARGVRNAALDFDTLLRVVLLHREEGRSGRQEEVVRALVLSALEQAVVGFVSMREREEQATCSDLLQRNARLAELVSGIRVHSANSVGAYRDALLARLRQLGLEINLDDERFLRELAFFADRVDVAEELTRLDSHLAQFRATIELARSSDEPVGRKLEFLIQEINREFNTIGSKANNIEVTRRVLDAKNEVERQREQVQNVE
jgi:uncharacterized protein (TIGR00255 family)